MGKTAAEIKAEKLQQLAEFDQEAYRKEVELQAKEHDIKYTEFDGHDIGANTSNPNVKGTTTETNKTLPIVLTVLGLLAIAGGGYWYYCKNYKK